MDNKKLIRKKTISAKRLLRDRLEQNKKNLRVVNRISDCTISSISWSLSAKCFDIWLKLLVSEHVYEARLEIQNPVTSAIYRVAYRSRVQLKVQNINKLIQEQSTTCI